MGKKLLVTGGSHAELPLIEAAKKEGWYVITTGNNEDGLGHKAADEYVPGDFSDKEFVYHLAKEKGVQAIVSGCNDFAYIATAYACEKLQLPGHDSYEVSKIIHHKNEFREMTRRLGIKTPKVFQCGSVEDLISASQEIQFPLVIKPIDLTGGKGVQICYNLEEAKAAYKTATDFTREAIVIAEECITGSNHGASMLLKDKRVVWSLFDNEQYFLNKYLVAGACSPSNIPQAAIFQLIKDVEKIAKHLCLADGLFHLQFILDDNGIPTIIDPCRRAPGDLYILLAKYVTEVDYPLEIVKAEVGEKLQDSYYCAHNCIARECIMAEKKGQIKEILIDEKIKEYIFDELIWGKTGDTVEDELKYKAGILFMRFESAKEMNDILAVYNNLVKIEVV